MMQSEGGTSKAYSFWSSLFPLYFVVFFVGAALSIILPSVAPYLKQVNGSDSLLALVISIFSVGEVIGAYSFGAISDRVATKWVLVFSLILGIIGQALYAAATNQWFLLVGRFVTGLWTGGDKTVERAYVVRATPVKERLTVLAHLNTCVLIGTILGPALGTIVSFVNFSVGPIDVGPYNAPGYVGVVVCFISIVILLIFFREKPLSETINKTKAEAGVLPASPPTPAVSPSTTTSPSSSTLESERRALIGVNSYNAEEEEDDVINNDATSTTEKSSSCLGWCSRFLPKTRTRPPYLLILACFQLLFVAAFAFAVIETITVPLSEKYYHWGLLECDLLFTGGGILNLITLLLLKYMGKVLSERVMLVMAIVITCGAFGLMTPWGKELPVEAFVAGFALFNVGFPMGRTIIFSIYSKKLGPWSEHMGTFMAWLVAIGSAARIGGPFFAQYSFSSVGPYVLFGATAGLNIYALLISIVCFKTFDFQPPAPNYDIQNVVSPTPVREKSAREDKDTLEP